MSAKESPRKSQERRHSERRVQHLCLAVYYQAFLSKDDKSNDKPNPEMKLSWYWRTRKALEGTNGQRLSSEEFSTRDLRGKWIIISGSNNGIGREAALFFARCGANIILACRTPPAHEKNPQDVVNECKMGSEASGHSQSIIEWWEVDMAKLSSVNAFADRWLCTNRVLNILCNNAGIGGNPKDTFGAAKKTEDGIELVHQVNFLSHVLLTWRLLPSLARAERPRIVCTTSCMMFFGNFDMKKFSGDGCSGEEFYCNNKLYLQIWLTEFQRRLSKSKTLKHIVINGVHPGYTDTGMWHVVRKPGLVNGIQCLLESVLVKTLARTFAISAEQGSYAIVNAALGPKMWPDTPEPNETAAAGGKYFNRIWEAETMPYCLDSVSCSLVWTRVMEELCLDDNELTDGRDVELVTYGQSSF